MFPGENLKLRSSDIAGNVHFSTYFCILKVFLGGPPSYRERDKLPESLKGGPLAPSAPQFLRPCLRFSLSPLLLFLLMTSSSF